MIHERSREITTKYCDISSITQDLNKTERLNTREVCDLKIVIKLIRRARSCQNVHQSSISTWNSSNRFGLHCWSNGPHRSRLLCQCPVPGPSRQEWVFPWPKSTQTAPIPWWDASFSPRSKYITEARTGQEQVGKRFLVTGGDSQFKVV